VPDIVPAEATVNHHPPGEELSMSIPEYVNVVLSVAKANVAVLTLIEFPDVIELPK